MQYNSVIGLQAICCCYYVRLNSDWGPLQGADSSAHPPVSEGREEARKEEGMAPFLWQQRPMSFLQNGAGHLASLPA